MGLWMLSSVNDMRIQPIIPRKSAHRMRVAGGDEDWDPSESSLSPRKNACRVARVAPV